MKALKAYVKRHNDLQALFKQEPKPFPTTPEECKPWFYRLEGELSPENLTCDGELSVAQVRKRAREIWKVWADLEQIFGREVGEGEPYTWGL